MSEPQPTSTRKLLLRTDARAARIYRARVPSGFPRTAAAAQRTTASPLTTIMLRSALRVSRRRLSPGHTRALSQSPRARSDDAGSPHVPGRTTTKLDFISSHLPDGERVPAYSVLDGHGNVLEGAELPEVRAEPLRAVQEHRLKRE
jgi:hypothetical protein